jgi:hypothetical protein
MAVALMPPQVQHNVGREFWGIRSHEQVLMIELVADRQSPLESCQLIFKTLELLCRIDEVLLPLYHPLNVPAKSAGVIMDIEAHLWIRSRMSSTRTRNAVVPMLVDGALPGTHLSGSVIDGLSSSKARSLQGSWRCIVPSLHEVSSFRPDE